MFCKYCGKVIDDDSTFCSYCGMSLNSSTISDSSKEEKLEDSIENDSSTNIPNPTFEVIVKRSNKFNTENKVRNTIKLTLKELVIIFICCGIAYVGKLVAYQINYISHPIPVVTAEEQEQYNLAMRGHPHCVGGIIELIKLGEFKYDSELTNCNIALLTNVTEIRTRILKIHSEKVSQYAFWLIFITLPLLRYLIIFKKWLVKDNNA